MYGELADVMENPSKRRQSSIAGMYTRVRVNSPSLWHLPLSKERSVANNVTSDSKLVN